MAIGKTLTVYLAADTAKLRAGLNSADRSLSGFGNTLSKMVGPALIGAGAAAGAFAASLAIDGVQAAMKQEKELAQLGKTLENLGLGWASDDINVFVDNMQYAAGVADTELRSAMNRLLTSTKNVTESQKLLQIALDTSAGTGKSLDAVVQALGKAYDGNMGGLSRLGAGITATMVKSKDLEGAVQKLSDTFGGQALAATETLAGQLTNVSIAWEDLKKAFGVGAITAVENNNKSLKNLTQTLRDAQPEAEDLGAKFGEITIDLINAALGFKKLYGASDEFFNRVANFGGPVVGALFNTFKDMLNPVGTLITKLSGMNAVMSETVGVKAFGTGGAMAKAKRLQEDAALAAGKLTTEQKSVTKSSGSMAKAVQEMDPALRRQIDLVKSLTTQLGEASKAVETARKEMYDWQNQMANQITSGIDLGAAFSAQFDAEGKSTGQSLIDGFNKQIEQAGLFGGYLQTLNTQGGPELRDAVAALGPEIGNKLAKQIIDDGLVKTFQEKLVTVKSTARTAAEAMTPEFLVAGVNSAVNFLVGTQNALAAATSQLEEMGRAMGKTIGDAAAKEIADAIAAARGMSESSYGTLAQEASIQAPVIAGSPFLNGTAIAQAIQRAIEDSNQRLGRTGQVVLQ